ncbi:unnamed protein product [Allacma fusca]|uniref:Uncharacterized protein n=1 Tax=Allacma fusca TaxID=39272 RepID=A0A8J2P4R6_9HEXA|nr:unnamed protein product [Allacma fusca]
MNQYFEANLPENGGNLYNNSPMDLSESQRCQGTPVYLHTFEYAKSIEKFLPRQALHIFDFLNKCGYGG